MSPLCVYAPTRVHIHTHTLPVLAEAVSAYLLDDNKNSSAFSLKAQGLWGLGGVAGESTAGLPASHVS